MLNTDKSSFLHMYIQIHSPCRGYVNAYTWTPNCNVGNAESLHNIPWISIFSTEVKRAECRELKVSRK